MQKNDILNASMFAPKNTINKDDKKYMKEITKNKDLEPLMKSKPSTDTILSTHLKDRK